MSELFQAAVLGIVQGLSEFFPISSSGHLVVLPKIFGWNGVVDSLLFDVALHLGTSLAVIAFFWKDWYKLIKTFFNLLFFSPKKILTNFESRLLLLIVLGSFPAALFGFLFKDFFETSARNSLLVGVNLILFGLLLWFVDRRFAQTKSISNIGWKESLIVGCGQALSLIPGVSRSGITITAARFQEIKREESVKFSFLLSTPAILGAGLLTSLDLFSTKVGDIDVFLVGFVFSAFSGFLAIKALLYLARQKNFDIFVVYRLAFGTFLISWFLFIL